MRHEFTVSDYASVMAGKDVDALMAASGHPRRAEIDRLRTAILTAVPGLTEQVKWNAPSFAHHGADRVTFRLHPPHRLQLIFHRGAKVRSNTAAFSFDDPTGLLSWPAPDRAILTLDEREDIHEREAAVVDLVQRWVIAANEAP